MPAFPDINGVQHSYASIELGIAGFYFPWFTEINYRTTHDIAKVRGTSSLALGRTRGTEDAEGSITLWKSKEGLLLAQLGAGGVGYAELSRPITVVYAEMISPQDIVQDILMGVRFHSPEDSHSEGPEGLLVTYQLSIMQILKNGLPGLRPQ